MAIILSGGTNTIDINGVNVTTDDELALKAPLNSPTFTGTPTAPTATAGTNNTQIATTAYVDGKMVLATAVTASGTAIDFTGIPSWAKRITVMFNGVSTSGASIPIIQLGDSGGIEATGYGCTGSSIAGTVASVNYTAGFGIGATGVSSFIRNGLVTINLLSSNSWAICGFMGQSEAPQTITTSGSKTLSGTLDRIRITTVNGTDTFDAGTINIMYEG